MVDIELKEKPLEPEISLIAAIFNSAKNDYLASWRKIQLAGGIEYLKDKYDKSKYMVKKYNSSISRIKKENSYISEYNKNNLKKKELLPFPKESEDIINAKKYIEKYVSIIKYAEEVEIFMKSKWFENLATYAGLDPNFIRNQFHKLRDEIVEDIQIQIVF